MYAEKAIPIIINKNKHFHQDTYFTTWCIEKDPNEKSRESN